MIDTGLILAAGEGSRLRAVAPYKPLYRIAGQALIDHALLGMAAAGLTRAIVTLGYGADAVAAHLTARRWPLQVETVTTDHRLPNGVSALAAAPLLRDGPAVMAMCDHLVTPAHYRRLARTGADGGLVLGIDRDLANAWVDRSDVTAVATRGDRIVAIGKGLTPHDCYDTGVFAVERSFFATLAALPAPSITDAVRVLAGDERAGVVDCSDLPWLDVDDPAATRHAEAWSGRRAA